jgi:hypothetical protein
MKLHTRHAPILRQIAIFSVPITLLLFVLAYNIANRPAQQFSDLAQSLLHGHLYFLHSIGGVGEDPILYGHHQYWGEGAFPAIILVPFIALFDLFHAFFYQGYIDWLLVVGTLYFVYSLARRFQYTAEDSLTLMLGFALGSAYIGIAAVSSSWLYAQVVSTFLLFWSLHEYFTRKRWRLIGLLCACIFLTRATAVPVIIFFGLEIWQTGDKRGRVRQLLQLTLPLIGALGLQGLYNFLRFHSPLNGGYEYQLVATDTAESRSLGVFSLRHIPANLFSLLLGTPNAVTRTSTSWSLKFPFVRNNNYGLSIFVTSPYFLYLLGRKWGAFSRTARHLLAAAACSCFFVLCFYGIGRNQFGYRYSLDFLPELFVVLMLVYRAEHTQLSNGIKFLLLAAGVCNFCLVATFVF